MDSDLNCLGALALELTPGDVAARAVLERDAAEALAPAFASDLQRLVPGVAVLDAGLAAALFDPAELLRPGWPLFGALSELVAAAPGRRGGRLMTFGAQAGRMPVAALQPDPALAGGSMRLLPFALLGGAGEVMQVSSHMEEHLLDTGMASAELALACQQALGVRLEHARWMSLYDLCALTAMQYRHAGCEGVWRLVEAALLAPEREAWLREDGWPPARYADGRVRLAAAAEADPELRMRQRQLEAVLGVHGIPVDAIALPFGVEPEALLSRPPQ